MTGSDPHEAVAEAFEAQRERLVAVAYRMLGSRADAEDAVQEAWLRLARQEPAAIDNLAGWLTTVVGRICIDTLRSRKVRPEAPYHDQLPELVVTTDAGGNSHTDTMLTVRACEQAGVRTTTIVAEMADPDSTSPGLTDWVPEADSIVSAGNAEELVPSWAPERIIGGETLLDGTDAREAGPIPARNYLGATNQMGQHSLTAAAW